MTEKSQEWATENLTDLPLDRVLLQEQIHSEHETDPQDEREQERHRSLIVGIQIRVIVHLDEDLELPQEETDQLIETTGEDQDPLVLEVHQEGFLREETMIEELGHHPEETIGMFLTKQA